MTWYLYNIKKTNLNIYFLTQNSDKRAINKQFVVEPSRPTEKLKQDCSHESTSVKT